MVPARRPRMPYVEGRIVHDADSHVMETPDWLVTHADPHVRERLRPLFVASVRPGEESHIDAERRRYQDPAERRTAEQNIMLRKNWSALGSFVKEDRPHALALLRFAGPRAF